MMRVIFLLIFLAGAGIAFGYPLVLKSGARDIGNWNVEADASGFTPVEATLKASDAPFTTVLDVTAIVPAAFDKSQTVLTITAATGGRTVLAQPLSLEGAEVREDSPQTPQQIYRIEAGTIPTAADGAYTFTVGPGDAEGVEVWSVALILQSGNGAVDPRAQPLGFSLMAIGFIVFVLSFRRGSRSGDIPPTAPPPAPPRWGRDAAGR